MKEMKNVQPAFEEWEGTASKIYASYQEVTCHMIFDVKMLDSNCTLRRKARYVAGGHTTETPAALTYASVVSRDSVRIALTIGRPTTKGWEILVKWKDGKYNLDFTQGYKRIISGSTGRICWPEPHFI